MHNEARLKPPGSTHGLRLSEETGKGGCYARSVKKTMPKAMTAIDWTCFGRKVHGGRHRELSLANFHSAIVIIPLC